MEGQKRFKTGGHLSHTANVRLVGEDLKFALDAARAGQRAVEIGGQRIFITKKPQGFRFYAQPTDASPANA